jgi:acetylornithine deacetylase/succinyl-diaminopimelate desuccinylase-like protein
VSGAAEPHPLRADADVALHERPVELLQRLLRFDTTNPPGSERECIEWLDGVLRGAGLETRVVAADPERPNLIARLRGEAGRGAYGFLPMQLPRELRFLQLLHAADERLPVDAVEFGADAVREVLERYGR